MKIIHLTHTDISQDNRIIKELNGLKKYFEDKNIYIHGYGVKNLGNNNSIENKICSSNYTLINVRWKQFKLFPLILKYILFTTNVWIKFLYYGIKEKPDLVHCHDTLVLPVALILKFIHKSRIIYDAHELESKAGSQLKIFGKIIYFFEKICWNQVDHFITVSEKISEWYMENLGKKKYTIILNSPQLIQSKSSNNLEYFENDYLRKKFSIPKTEKIFISVGHLGPEKGVKSIIKVFNDKNLTSHVVFLGFGQWENLVRNESHKNPKIHLHPPVEHELVVPLTKHADYGLCLVEGLSLNAIYCLPNKLFELIFAGLPIVATNFPEIKRIVENYNLGECVNDNTNDILDGITKIKSFDIRNFKEISPLSWKTQEKKLGKLYEEVLFNKGKT